MKTPKTPLFPGPRFSYPAFVLAAFALAVAAWAAPYVTLTNFNAQDFTVTPSATPTNIIRARTTNTITYYLGVTNYYTNTVIVENNVTNYVTNTVYYYEGVTNYYTNTVTIENYHTNYVTNSYYVYSNTTIIIDGSNAISGNLTPPRIPYALASNVLADSYLKRTDTNTMVDGILFVGIPLTNTWGTGEVTPMTTAVLQASTTNHDNSAFFVTRNLYGDVTGQKPSLSVFRSSIATGATGAMTNQSALDGDMLNNGSTTFNDLMGINFASWNISASSPLGNVLGIYSHGYNYGTCSNVAAFAGSVTAPGTSANAAAFWARTNYADYSASTNMDFWSTMPTGTGKYAFYANGGADSLVAGPFYTTSASVANPATNEFVTKWWVTNEIASSSSGGDTIWTNNAGVIEPMGGGQVTNVLRFTSGLADNATNAVLVLDTANSATVGNSLMVRTKGTNLFYIKAKDGSVMFGPNSENDVSLYDTTWYMTRSAETLNGDAPMGNVEFQTIDSEDSYAFFAGLGWTWSGAETDPFASFNVGAQGTNGITASVRLGADPSRSYNEIPIKYSLGNTNLFTVNYDGTVTAPTVNTATANIGTGTVTNNLGAVLAVGATDAIDLTYASATNNVTGALTFLHATNGVNLVEKTHVRWLPNGSGSDQTLTIPSGWRTNAFSAVPTKLTNGWITVMYVKCWGPTSSAALQTNAFVSFEYYK